MILYGIMQGTTSLRAMERLARMDLGCMWVSGGIFPDHANVGRFINRHAEQLTGSFFLIMRL
ncbi:transposase [Endozoicomonas sp. SCSIO W0465]|uniref:transposase n=1 Tax=Endozoicomonas sp. SCSIO W0465 TaxID=2918516 RepID=UPI0020754DDB|nr:transposase [Endozoicomonas sp. SCSIO W0465]USE35108.1 transposase [Endozoicomonas sp. SCSIO W0465]